MDYSYEEDAGSVFLKFDGMEVRTAFQGIFHQGKVIYGYEALIRVRKIGSQEPVSPQDFIESISFPYNEFAFYLVNKLHLINFNRLSVKHPNVRLFVNITPSFFDSIGSRPEMKRMVLDLMKETETPSDLFVAEILESESSKYPGFEAGIEFIKSIDVAAALDDYGDEHSNIARYDTLKPDIVKISRNLYLKSISDPKEFKKLAVLIKRFKADNAKVVVEGIEHDEHLDELCTIGIDFFQGYLFHVPEMYHEKFKGLNNVVDYI